MNLFFRGIFLIIFSVGAFSAFASDTLEIKRTANEFEINQDLSILEDNSKKLSIHDILEKDKAGLFHKNIESKLNFKYSSSTYWLHLTVRNITSNPQFYILEISNPDLDYVSFYEVDEQDNVLREVHTGELLDVGAREIYNRRFLFQINLDAGSVRTYYISVNNNSHPCTVPLAFMQRSFFERNSNKADAFNWSIYGLLIFIIIFNFYLYFALNDKVNLYYSLGLLFAVITFMFYDGYLYLINPFHLVENVKWLPPSLYSVFLLLFTRSFVTSGERFTFINRIIPPLIIVVLIFPIAYNFKYPFSLIADIGIPVIVLIEIVFIIRMSIASFRRHYLPSHLFLLAFICLFIGLLIHQLKEFDLISPSFLVIDSIKIGLTLQNILLTIAVLERFRYNQDLAQRTIEENLRRIEIQNKELEIINTELEKLSIVASETDNSIAIYGNEGRLEWGNTGFEKLYKISINDLIRDKKDRIEDIIPNRDINMYMQKCRDTMLAVVFETPVYSKNKKVTWVQTTLSPFIRKGEIFKIIAIDSDITSLKDYGRELEIAKDKAEESDRLKTAFLHNISHEIRTPMNAIIGFSGLLNDENCEKEKRSQYTDIIAQSSNHLLSVINDIMRIASIEAGQENLSESRFDLNLIFEYLHEQFWLKAREQNPKLEIKVEVPEEDHEIVADETKLVQILSNLIDNAFKFTSEGTIVFGYRMIKNEIEFFVKDSGIGIEPGLHEEIFKRFHQVENTNTRKFGGSGLGLSISKAYVELMGGRIWVSSELNKGSVFYFTIPYSIKTGLKPVSPIKKNDDAEKALKPVSTSGKIILIAEDEESNFDLLSEQISELEVNVIRARNGLEAVEICRNEKIDMVLMDIKMPVMDGFTATLKIREFLPDLPIVAQTAFNSPADQERAMANGFSDFLSKPMSKDKILYIIRNYLDGI